MSKIFLYTGDGGGKTTNALGAALRCLGHDKEVVIIQFLKWFKHTGEYKFKHPMYTILQFGRSGWKSRDELGQQDKDDAVIGLHTAEIILRECPPSLLILDELNLAVSLGLIDVEYVLAVLNEIPENTTIFITGREAPQELIDRADFVIEIKPIKIPEESVNIEGINY